jgi:hypothetical protein
MKIQKPKRLATPLKRKVHVNGKVWTYMWAGWGKVCILNPSRTRKWDVTYNETSAINGYDDDAHEARLTPSWVKEFIVENLLQEAWRAEATTGGSPSRTRTKK